MKIYYYERVIITIIIVVVFIIIIIIIIMFLKGKARFLFFDPLDEVGPSISSLVVLCFFVLLVDIVVLVSIFYLFPFSVSVVATSLYYVL